MGEKRPEFSKSRKMETPKRVIRKECLLIRRNKKEKNIGEGLIIVK
jgi:hypothetical protein